MCAWLFNTFYSSGWGWRWNAHQCREQLQRRHQGQPPACRCLWVRPGSKCSSLQWKHSGLRRPAGLHDSWDASPAPEHTAGWTHPQLPDAGTGLPPSGEGAQPGLPTPKSSAHCWEVLGKMQSTSSFKRGKKVWWKITKRRLYPVCCLCRSLTSSSLVSHFFLRNHFFP